MPVKVRRLEYYWKDTRLYAGTRLSGYSIIADERYPNMWRIKLPDGRLTDMVNRARAKEAAMAMLDRDSRVRETAAEAAPAR